MEELSKHGQIGRAAMKAGMDRKTARRHRDAGTLPSQRPVERYWRTREDPFTEHENEIEQMLRDAPGLEAKTVFAALCERYPGQYEPGQLRTLQRRVQQWRAMQGEPQQAVLIQSHRPGEAAQTDFTHGKELGVTIAGVLFVHLLCVVALPYSNWSWATVCMSESIAAIRKGLQRALVQLGRVPEFHQTDNSTAATHRVPKGEARTKNDRRFNEEYLAIMRHYGMTPRTTEAGAKEQNGDVEASNGAIKRRLEQALLLRGHRDFDSVEQYQRFINEAQRKMNGTRGTRLAEELAAMRALTVTALVEYSEEMIRVSERSTIHVRRNLYSVPSRLIGQRLRVRIYDDRIEALFGNALQMSCERLHGQGHHRIDYRHMIWSLLRRPGAFARYSYRDEMFPTLTFRRAYDAMQSTRSGLKGDVEYLRLLQLAASTMESDVESALQLLFEQNEPIEYARVRELVEEKRQPKIPEIPRLNADLRSYDALIEVSA